MVTIYFMSVIHACKLRHSCSYWNESILKTGVNDIMVMIDSFLINRGAWYSKRKYPRPTDRETVVWNPNGGQTGNILLVKIIVETSFVRELLKQ